MIGRTISHYRILEKLGAGGMGVVYKAEDTRLKRLVALKFLPPQAFGDPEEKARLIREAQAAAALDHPNICTVYEIGEAEGETFIAMAYIEGQTLRDKIRHQGVTLDEALELAIQICHALQEAHGKGVTHRDIKSGNVMITEKGQVKIMDFGLAQLSGQTRITRPGTTVGTPAYMPPEQTRGDTVDQRSDLWSLGVVLYEMVTGRLPFKGGSEASVVHSVLYENPQPMGELRTGVPEELEQIVVKALSKRPGQRYQTAQDMAADVQSLRRDLESGAAIPTRVTTVSSRVPTTHRTSRVAPAIAVLPFADMSPEKDQEYFCEGMAEEVINALAQVEGLRVVSRSSSFQFRGKSYDVRDVGEKLSVGAVLEGSVRRAGNRLRITAQLVGVSDGFHIWSERYDREMKDIFDVQDEISRAIVEALKVKLVGEQQKQLIKRYTENLEAYHLYLKGRYYWNQRVPGALKKAHEYFQQALAEDPNYALAYTGLADCYLVRGYFGISPPKEVMPQAKASVLKALDLDDTLAEAYTALGVVTAIYEFEWLEAEQHFRRALELNPGYATAHSWYAFFDLTPMGRLEEAAQESRRSQELDPLSAPINTIVGAILYFQRQYQAAIQELQKALELDRDFPAAHYYLAKSWSALGMEEPAIAAFQKAREASGNNLGFTGWLACCYGTWGRKSEAQQLLDEFQNPSQQRYVPAHSIGAVYLGLGDEDRAFEWFEQACEERSSILAWLNVDSAYDRVRSDARFAALAKKMGLGN